MMKHGQYYLRLVLRSFIAFAMIFSIMLCNSANKVYALVQENYIVYDDRSWTSPMISYSLDGSVVNGTWNGSISYDFTPQFAQGQSYIMQIFGVPTITKNDPKHLLESTVVYYAIIGGRKYYFDKNNSLIVAIPKEENSLSKNFSIGFDINYSVEPYKSSGVTAYMYLTLKMHCEVLIYKVDGSDSSKTIIDELKQNNNLQQQQNDLQQEQNKITNNIFTSISNFFGSFFDNLIGIFVPESGYFENFFQRLNEFFSEKLGMLYAPIDMFIGVLTAIKDSSGSDTGIQFPGLKWEDTYIIQPQTISLTSIANDFPGIQEKIYFATDVIMVGAVIWLLQVKLKEVLTT